jgi:hypothetical protein
MCCQFSNNWIRYWPFDSHFDDWSWEECHLSTMVDIFLPSNAPLMVSVDPAHCRKQQYWHSHSVLEQ